MEHQSELLHRPSMARMAESDEVESDEVESDEVESDEVESDGVESDEDGTISALHLWGHCDGLGRPHERVEIGNHLSAAELNIVIHSHAYQEVTWNGLRQRDASEHTRIRLDRWSSSEDWQPDTRYFKYEVRPNEWIGAYVCLFDRKRNGRILDMGLQISNAALQKVVHEYFNPETIAGEHKMLSSDIQGDNHGTTQAQIPAQEGDLHGRRRRQRLRRQERGNQLGAVEHRETTSVLAFNEVQRILSFRLPASWRGLPRIMIGPASEDYSDAIVLGLSAQGTGQLVGCLALSKNLQERPYYGNRTSKVCRSCRLRPFRITASKIGGRNSTVDASPEYWHKFTRNLPRTHLVKRYRPAGEAHTTDEGDLTDEEHEDIPSLVYISHETVLTDEEDEDFLSLFDLSLWHGFKINPPLVYPDLMKGGLAEESDYLEQFFCSPYGRFDIWRGYETQKVTDLEPRYFREGLKGWVHHIERNWALRCNKQGNGENHPTAIPLDIDESEIRDELCSNPPNEPFTTSDLALNAGAYYYELMSRTGVNKSDFRRKSAAEFLRYDAPRELWYGLHLKGHIMLCHQEQIVNQIKDILITGTTKCSIPPWHSERTARAIATTDIETHQQRSRNQAMLEFGVCLLTGFGIRQNIDSGLDWIYRSSRSGCRLARAVTHRLQRAYRRPLTTTELDVRWLVAEAKCFSYWALRELEDIAEPLGVYVRCLRLYYAKYTETWGKWGLLKNGERDSFANFDSFVARQIPSCWRQLFLSDKGFVPLDDETLLLDTFAGPWLSDEKALDESLASCLSQVAPDSPSASLYYHAATRCVCCLARPEMAVKLTRKWLPFTTPESLLEYLLIALHRGCAPLAEVLLADGRLEAQKLSPGLSPLFLLYNVSDQYVGRLVNALVCMGCDVNQKADPLAVELNAMFPMALDEGDLIYGPAAENLKLPGWRTAGWLHFRDEIGGESITPLRWAIIRDKPALVEALLEAGAEFPKVPDRDVLRRSEPTSSWPAEICSVAVLDQPCYNIRILRIFLARHGAQKGQPPFAETPLGLIVMEPDTPTRRLRMVQHNQPDGLSHILSLLRQYQASDDAQLFWAACMNGHEDIVRYMVAEGVDIELRFKGMTPLHTSVLHGNLGIVNFLLANGADFRAITTNRKLLMLHLFFWIPKPLEIEQTMFTIFGGLLRDTITSDVLSNALVTPLHLAVLNGRLDAVRRLLDYGADPLAVLGEDIMPTINRGGRLSAWGIERQHCAAADFKRVFSNRVYTAMKVPTVPVSLQGCTAAGIVLLRPDMFLSHEANTMLELLLPFGTDPGRKAMFHVRPKGEHASLHLLAANPLRLKSKLSGRVLEALERAGLDVPDGDGDTQLHYACVALGGAGEQDGLLNELANGSVAEFNANKKNNLGLTPLDARFWSFINGDPQARAAVDIYITHAADRHRGRKAMRSGEATEKSDHKPRLSGGRMESFWWELEKGMDIQHVWDARKREMIQQSYSGRRVVLQNPLARVYEKHMFRGDEKATADAVMTIDPGQD